MRRAEYSIVGDEQEQERIRLEQDVASRLDELTFENTHSTELSLEFARHGATFSPRADSNFPSFAAHTHDMSYMDDDDHEYRPPSSLGPPPDLHRSYRTSDDSVARAGETFSTAQHHASAITLGAGLGRYGGTPSTRSAAAEFDPERRVPDLLGADRGLSILDESRSAANRSRRQSKRSTSGNQKPSSFKQTYMPSFVSAEPIIVEDTAELDRALESGHFEVPQEPSAERHHDDFLDRTATPTTSEEDESSFPHSEDATASPPTRATKLSDALGKVGSKHQHRPQQQQQFSPHRPRSAQGFHRSKPHHSAQPSQFTQAARGLARDIEREQESAEREANNLFASTAQKQEPEPRKGHARKHKAASFQFPAQTSVHLPDVTGLTSAIETPNKASRRYRQVKERHADASIVQATIEKLANRLRELETENVTSRRRVRELELDLDHCKADVLRERTRVQAEIQKQLSLQQQDLKGKLKAGQVASGSRAALGPDEMKLWESRYKEVVDTKKALESLVTSLRTQLAQMTAELETHKHAVEELRALRDEDEVEIERRCLEVEQLRAEVERLGAEVIRLRNIIEDSVRERREAASIREESLRMDEEEEEVEEVQQAHEEEEEPEEEEEEEDLIQLTTVPEENSNDLQAFAPTPERSITPQQRHLRPSSRASRPASRAAATRAGSSRPQADEVDDESWFSQGAHQQPQQTMTEARSFAATAGSSARARRFVTTAEMEQAESDVEDRRSVRSDRSTSTIHRRHAPSPLPSPRINTAPLPLPRHPEPRRPSKQSAPNTDAFPQIRGARMEKLFFSLPDHNEATCNVCHRRSEAQQPKRRVVSDPTVPGRASTSTIIATAMAPGFDPVQLARMSRRKDEDEGLPPQTVLARVLRELEDDFTHYKGIFIELAEQYAVMDPASNVLKRNVLAEHLKEVVATLESKGDQIAALYDLFSFKKKANNKLHAH